MVTACWLQLEWLPQLLSLHPTIRKQQRTASLQDFSGRHRRSLASWTQPISAQETVVVSFGMHHIVEVCAEMHPESRRSHENHLKCPDEQTEGAFL